MSDKRADRGCGLRAGVAPDARRTLREPVGETHKGEHAPILERELFDSVQAKLADRVVRRKMRRSRSPSLLIGLIFDDRGNPMSPSHANKKGVRYR